MTRWHKLSSLCTTSRTTIDPHRTPDERFWHFSIPAFDEGETPALVLGSQIRSNKILIERPCILFSRLNPRIRRVWDLTELPNRWRSVASTEFVPFIIKDPARLHPRYLHWFMFTDQFLQVARSAVRAATKSRERVEVGRLFRAEVPLPGLWEQQRIAAILDTADAIRRKRQETMALTEELLRSTFLEMFGDPLTNPKGWPTKTIGEIAPKPGQIVDGPFGSTLKPDCYVIAGVRVIRNFNIHDAWFDDSDFRYVTSEKFLEIRRSEVQSDDILISTKGTVGDVCRMPNLPGESVLSATGTARIRVASPEWEPDFIVHQMILPSYKTYVQRRQAGSIQKYLNLSGIRGFSLIKPPVELQKLFVKFAECNRQLRERIELHQSESDELFNSLVQRAFRGEL